MRCKGKDCESKCGDNNILFNLAEQKSNKCEHFEIPSLATECRRRYKLDQRSWICSSGHEVSGVEEGKEATPCPVCKESFEARLIAYLTFRLNTLGLDAEEGTNRLYFKAAGVPGPISYDQFLRVLLGSHGQAGSGLGRAAGVSAKMACTNQCTRPTVDLKEAFPKHFGDKEFSGDKIAPLLDAIHQQENPGITFNPCVFAKSFGSRNIQTYLWCELAMLVGKKQEAWTRYNNLVPLKLWNCREPVIYGKLQSLSLEAGTSNTGNIKLHPCVLNWLKMDETRSNTARFGDLTLAIQTSQVKRKIRTTSPGREDLTLDESVSGLNLNVAEGPVSFSNDALWRAHGPQTLQQACSFVRRVIESMSSDKTSVTKTVQQVLRKDARDALRKEGVVEMLISDSETSETEPKGDVEARTKKRKHSSNKEEPKTKALSNQGGGAGSNSKSSKSNNTRSRQDPPPPKRSRGGSNKRGRGSFRPNPFHRQGDRSPPRDFRCRNCNRSCDRYDHYCRGCGRQQE